MRTAAICNFIASAVLTVGGTLDVLYASKVFGIVGLWLAGANFMMALVLSRAGATNGNQRSGK